MAGVLRNGFMALLIAASTSTLVPDAAKAAPGDFDGDNISDFTIVRHSYADDLCSRLGVPLWANCQSTQRLVLYSWFTRPSSRPAEQQIVSTLLPHEESDGFTVTHDPSLSIDSRSGAPSEATVATYYSGDPATAAFIEPEPRIRSVSLNGTFAHTPDALAEYFDFTKFTPGERLTAARPFAVVSADVGGTGFDREVTVWRVSGLEGSPEECDEPGENCLLWTIPPWVLEPNAGHSVPQFDSRLVLGGNDDLPVPADYDGDGRDEIAVYNNRTGVWKIRNLHTDTDLEIQWGLPEDRPMPGDYDGDGHADLAVWRPESGVWYILRSSTGYNREQARIVQFGLPLGLLGQTISIWDLPVRGDFDGDGRVDLAVFRYGLGYWFVLRSSDGVQQAVQWGLPGDCPVGMSIADRIAYWNICG